jgi:hypothetical protein
MESKSMKNRTFAVVLAIFSVVVMGCPNGDDNKGNGTETHVHQWGDWIVTKAPTETKEGEETRTCTLDPSHKETRPIAKLTHVHQWGDWAETKAATCTTAGEEIRVCALDATHTETRTGVATLGHDWEWVVTTPATYTAEGTETKTCKHDPSYTDGTRPIPQLTYTAPNITELGTWLTSQPANTADTAYKIVLNVNDISNIRTILNAQPDKYVYLDLSGSTITTIPERLFSGSASPYGCATLAGIAIPDTVTSIGSRAFYYCTSLASVTIPDSVTSIEQYAFARCTSLVSVIIPNSVTSIGESAFLQCSSLTSVTIGNGVISIGFNAFYNCASLTSIIIPNSVTNIGEWAFQQCSSLTSVTIPDSVTNIESAPFYNCTSLTVINVDAGNNAYIADNGVLYNKDKTSLIQYPAGKTDTTFTIPNSVTTIEILAFYNCASLIGVTIPASVISIKGSAFYNCASLASVTFAGTIPSSGFDSNGYNPVFFGDLRAKFYASNASNGTPGTYTTTAPVGENSVWTKQN